MPDFFLRISNFAYFFRKCQAMQTQKKRRTHDLRASLTGLIRFVCLLRCIYGNYGNAVAGLTAEKACIPLLRRQQNAGDATASCTPARTPHERIYGNIELVNMDGYPIFHRFAAGVPANHPNGSRNGPPRNRAGPVPGKIPAPCTAWLPMLRQQTLPASTGLYGLSCCHAPYTPRQAG